MHIKKLSLLFLLLCSLLSCALFQKDTEKNEDLLPRDIELPGWRTVSAPKIFSSKNYWEYINNQELAHLLEAYGFQELSIAEYSTLSDPEKTIKVELFGMKSSLNAFGIYSMQRSNEAVIEEICEDSYSIRQELFGRKNNFYIRIQNAGTHTGAGTDNKLFLKIICDKIKSTDRLPDYLSLFGRKDYRRSLTYLIEGHPKLSKINKIFSKKIDIEGKTNNIFFAKRKSNFISMGEFSGLLKDKESQFILSSAGEIQVAFLKIKENEFIFISVYKEWIFGIFEAASMAEGEKAVNYIYIELKAFLKQSG